MFRKQNTDSDNLPLMANVRPVERLAPDGSRLRLHTLILVRWIAVVGQSVAILVVHFGLGYKLPLALSLVVIGLLAISNIFLSLARPARTRLGNRDGALLLGFDVIQLAALLYLTGGLANPFAILILAPVSVSATILSRGTTVLLLLLAVSCVTVLAFYHRLLPWGPGGFELPFTYLLGIWTALSVAAVFVSLYVWSVAEEARRMSNALVEAQVSLAREQRVSALGGLAAAAAHELGSPLATIAVIAKELSREVRPESDLADDVALLLGQSERCRDILASLSQRSSIRDGDDRRSSLALTSLVSEAADLHDDSRVIVEVRTAENFHEVEPLMQYGPEVLHGIGNLIQNAVQFAHTTVNIWVEWDNTVAQIVISDDGPGFPGSVLSSLGEPYVSGRPNDSSHMGLGIFIARTLLERTGASLSFANGIGAEVSITWQREGDHGLARSGQ